MKLASAVAFAKQQDSDDMFKVRFDVGDHAVQSAISCIAACVIRFSQDESDDLDWAREVMERVWNMQERPLNGSHVPWHPFNHLIAALVQQRVNNNQDTDAVAMLLELADHPQEDVSALAVAGLLRDDDLALTWVAALLVMRRAIRWRSTWTPDRGHDHSRDRASREQALRLALDELAEGHPAQFPPMPVAWVQLPRGEEEDWDDGSDRYLRDPDPFFDWHFAAGIFRFSQLSGGALPQPTKATGNRRSMSFAHGLHHACFHRDRQIKNNTTQMGTSGMTR